MKAEYSGCQPDSMPRIDRCVKIVLDALFPMRCAVCNALDETGLCSDCYARIPRVENPCRQCGAPLGFSRGTIRCGRCQSRPPAYDLTIAPFTYAPPFSIFIHQFKYHRRISMGRSLAMILAGEIKTRNVELPELIVPVPLHWTRLMQRGFNQSLEFCRHLSAELDVPFVRHVVRRTRKTPPQINLPLRYRQQNVRACFGIYGLQPAKSIAIVDDVITSGETVNQIASLLKLNEVSRIQCWALLRTHL